MFDAIQQSFGVGGIAARLELPQPDEPRHAAGDRLVEQMFKVAEARAGPARSDRNGGVWHST